MVTKSALFSRAPKHHTIHGFSFVFLFSSLQSLNISWTSLDSEHIAEIANHVNENLLRLNIAGCRKTLTDAGK